MTGQIGDVVLDLGSGDGGWVRRLREATRARIICVDHVDMGASQVPGVEFRLTDLSRDVLSLADGSVDTVTCLEVIEHLANPRHMVAEASRVLRSGGSLWLTTPSCDSLRARSSLLLRGYFPAFCDHDYEGSGHITPITELNLRRMAREAGFSATSFCYAMPGQLPMRAVNWQSFAPWLRGRAWTDCTMCRMTK